MNHAHFYLLSNILLLFFGSANIDSRLYASNSEWPQTVTYPADITVEIVHQAPGAAGSLYRSNHFELISDYPLAIVALCDVLRVLEASYASYQQLPLGFDHTPRKQRHVVKLIDSENQYVASGGVMGSGGAYLSESREALIRIDSLGAELSEDGQIRSIKNLGVITHEITHQLQHDWLQVLPTWLIEGMAVYLESVPFQNGTLRFDDMHFRSEKHLLRCTENRYWMTDIEQLMTINREEWNQSFAESVTTNDRHYVSAFLLTYYFLHLIEDAPGKHLRTYIESLQQANSHADQQSALTKLMQGQSYQELEHDIIRAYAQAGFELQPYYGFSIKQLSNW
ncbi:hypothetical protein ACWPKO_12795 [Coraliomargarita sp. W4R53]